MFKVIANILLAALAIGLTIFTGSRTLDLLQQWLPANQENMKYLGLAAFEGGLYFWAFYFVVGAKGAIQRGTAFMMIVISFIAVALATVADLMLVGAEDGKLPPINIDEKQAIVVFVGIVITLNVAAFLAAKLTHPDKLKEMAVQDAEDHIHAVNLAMIRAAAPNVAAHAAPIMTDRWVSETWGRMLPGTTRPVLELGPGREDENVITSEVQEIIAEQDKPKVVAGKGGVIKRFARMFSSPADKVEPAMLQQTASVPAASPVVAAPTITPSSLTFTPTAPRPFIPPVSPVAARRSLRRQRTANRRKSSNGGTGTATS